MKNYEEPNNSQKKEVFSVSFRGVHSNLRSTIKMIYWKEHSMLLRVHNNDGPLEHWNEHTMSLTHC